MNVYTIECEWDIGTQNRIFSTEKKARKIASESLVDCGIEDSFEELDAQGLITIYRIEVE